MYDVITIGAATLDIFLDIHEAHSPPAGGSGRASEHCCIKKDETGEWFCLRRGEKIPVDALHFDIGGNAANVAVGLARLGITTATYIHYGSDEISQKIVNVLKQEGVGTEFLVQDANETSPISIVINFQGERTLFAHHIVRDHALLPISVPKWIYLTSVGERWENLYRQTVEFVRENNVKFAFSPGSHQLDSGVESFIEQVKSSYALFLNREEAIKITNDQGLMTNDTTVDEQEGTKKLLTQLQSIGPRIISITDGSNGSYAIDEQSNIYQLGVFPATVLERTGAGDSYAAGFLAALVHGLPVAEAMRWGAINAASVVSAVGAEKGLLRKDEIEKKLAEHPEFTAKPF